MSKSNRKNQYCKEANKYTYPSEAAASRALNKYDDIKRTYPCESCGGWHITSMGMGLALRKGIINRRPKKKKNGYSADKIQNRLDFLRNKLDKNA